MENICYPALLCVAGNLILGVLYGMANELKTYFDRMGCEEVRYIVAAGNGVKKNPVLQKVLEKTFHYPIGLTANNEEAAYGSALFAGICCGEMDLKQAKEMIRRNESEQCVFDALP